MGRFFGFKLPLIITGRVEPLALPERGQRGRHDHRLIQNFRKGCIGDGDGPLLAAFEFHLKKSFNRIIEEIAIWLQIVLGTIRQKIAGPELKSAKPSF